MIAKPTLPCERCGIPMPARKSRHATRFCSTKCSAIATRNRPKPGCVWRMAAVDANGCWLWTGRLDRDGYGANSPHRAAWEYFRGQIPAGLQTDHLCRVRSCCNPDHLELVTPRENTMRGNGNARVNAAKVVCIHGHPFTPENTYVHPIGSPRAGRRTCRTCLRRSYHKYYAKRSAG